MYLNYWGDVLGWPPKSTPMTGFQLLFIYSFIH